MFGTCNITRSKMCYLVLALSIFFFLSSVCTYAVLAVAKQKTQTVQVIKNKVNNKNNNNQSKILKRLKRIEERMSKRKLKRANDE